MSALVGRPGRAPALPMHPNVLLGNSERVMEGSFGAVTQSLMRLGTCAIEDLARSPKADLEGFDLPNVSSDFELLRASSQPPPDSGPVVSDDKESQKVPSSMQFVAQLHQTCVGAFGNSEALKFEFLEETGQEDKKQCILTITRPNGQIRSYATPAEYSRKSDAKARAAAIAVEMGAIDFILHGNKDPSASKLILAPLDSSTATKPEAKSEEDSLASEAIEDGASKQIEALCIEWRAGRIQPRWVFFKENKASLSWGCALVIELSPHSQRLYSVYPRYNTKPLTRKACSESALRDGVVDFIKYGNGQTAPARVVLDPLDNVVSKREPDIDRRGRTAAISLQSFFDSLPKPFPEPLEDKPIASINVPGMLNTTVQLAKGARLSLQFYFVNENGLQGSILRLERPGGETKTYMVDTKFMKRSDAKAAVCLQAMSQGISKYIRSLAAAVDNKITPEMRKLANEQILPILGSEYGKLRFGMHPLYDYEHDNGAFGCTMTLSLSVEAKPGETRSWSVKPEYRTKTDAKIAVVCAAGAEAIEFVRFKGQPAPPDHNPFKSYRHKNTLEQRSGTGSSVQLEQQYAPLLETKEEAMARHMTAASRGHAALSTGRSNRYQSAHNRASHRGPPFAPGANRQYGPTRRATHWPSPSYNSSTHTSAVTHQVDKPSSYRKHNPVHHSTRQQSPPAHPSEEYSQSAVAKLRPPRKSQQQQRPSQRTPTAEPSPPPAPQQQTQHTQQSPSHPEFPTSHPVLSQPSLPSQPFAPYATPPPPHQVIPPQTWSIPTPGYAQPPPPYPYSVPQGTPYPPPPNGYPYAATPAPPPPPTYGIPGYPSYSAYYADPRYPQYPQYTMPGAPMPYAVPVAPALGMQYHSPPPPPPTSVPTPAQPVNSTQMNTTVPTAPCNTDSDRAASAHWIEIDVSSIRAGSFNAESDRQKRRRSRDMSMSPDDIQLNKKHRSELSSAHTKVKRESKNASPSHPTPVSASKDSTSHVQELLRYCESEGLSSPEFGSKQVKNESGVEVFKVWIVMGKERLELPVTFASENEGRQRVAKQVLQRLKSQAAKK